MMLETFGKCYAFFRPWICSWIEHGTSCTDSSHPRNAAKYRPTRRPTVLLKQHKIKHVDPSFNTAVILYSWNRIVLIKKLLFCRTILVFTFTAKCFKINIPDSGHTMKYFFAKCINIVQEIIGYSLLDFLLLLLTIN